MSKIAWTIPLTLLLVLAGPPRALSQQPPPGAIPFGTDTPTEPPVEEPLGFIPLFALPGTEIELHIDIAYHEDDSHTIRETIQGNANPQGFFEREQMRMLFVDPLRASYSTLRLYGDMDIDLPRARAFAERFGVGVHEEQMRARLLETYADDLRWEAEKWRAVPLSGFDGEGFRNNHGDTCQADTAYAMKTGDIAGIKVAETFSRVETSNSGQWQHGGWCLPVSPVNVSIPGANIGAFTTYWKGTCDHGAVERGELVRTRARGDYWNRDFPALEVGRVAYPGQTVYVGHQIDIDVNPSDGEFSLRSSYRHSASGTPSVLEVYVLLAERSHFLSTNTCQ